jgi:hypothetical protein
MTKDKIIKEINVNKLLKSLNNTVDSNYKN